MRGLCIWLGGGLSVTGPSSSANAALAAHACSTRAFTPAATMRRISPSRDKLKGVPGSRLTTSSADEPLDGNQALRDRVHRQEEALERDSAQERGTAGRDEARRGDVRAIEGQAHFGHRPLGPLAPGDQHRLGAPNSCAPEDRLFKRMNEFVLPRVHALRMHLARG
jgi:hypothetical protein